ncbi:MAG: GTPase HflX [Lentisphaeria bacterium]|nr:GTPase HflX [Lentisphaeria bacterium]MDP7741703.1 GTPase HflX [Lentisphaeria bacterium]
MFLFDEAPQEHNRAMLVGVETAGQDARTTQELLVELAELTMTYGVDVAGVISVRLKRPNPQFLIGSGKVDEIVAKCRAADVDVIIFDDTLSPAQQRNWEKLSEMRVIDRQEVILGIFGNRASTQEAMLQIELAQSEYMLPRLKRAWTHLGRQRGGVGVRGGEGEKQIEIDSRLIRTRISKLKSELKAVRRRRAEQRKKRQRVPVPNSAIVGYTNAGKSSLLNLLTNAEVLVEDKLFATLDPTTRRVELPNRQTLLLTDTVGFVRKLPHDLVEAFKATLEEAVDSEFLLLVLDASSPSVDVHYETTREVLKEIGIVDHEAIIVFNKVDLLSEPYEQSRLRRRYPDAVFISARTGFGIDTLLAEMVKILDRKSTVMHLRLPSTAYRLVAQLHRLAAVQDVRYEDDGIYVNAIVPGNRCHEFEGYVIEPQLA